MVSTPGDPIVVTPPAADPDFLVLAKSQCHVDHDAEDALIAKYIAGAWRLAQSYTNRLIMPQTVRARWDAFPHPARSNRSGWRSSFPIYADGRGGVEGVDDRALRLPGGPTRSIDSVQYYNAAGTLTALVTGTDYAVDLDSVPARIYPQPGVVWPFVRAGKLGGVVVQYKVGWPTKDDVPEDLQAAILLIVGYWHNNRGDAKDVGEDGLPPGARRILDNYRLLEYR